MTSHFSNSNSDTSTQSKTNISNLTKNLLSSQQHTQLQDEQKQSADLSSLLSLSQNVPLLQPPSYNATHILEDNNYIPGYSGSGNRDSNLSQSTDYDNHSSGSSNHFTNLSYPNQSSFMNRNNGQYNSLGNEPLNYIPSNHNIPTVVNGSYSSNQSYTPAFSGSNNFVPQQMLSQTNSTSGSYKPAGLMSTGIPTTNISKESANPILHSRSFSNSGFPQSSSFSNSSHGYNSSSFPNQPQANTFQSKQNRVITGNTNNPQTQSQESQTQASQIHNPNTNQLRSFSQEADHYMSYKEFLQNLSTEDSSSDDIDNEHLNIVDYPVNDLILMLSCLLSKIIEANDKLHPNHFDNTIAIRQKIKEEKKIKKQEKMKQKEESIDDDLDNNISNDDDENDDDAMKNKYLANVLAFHGTNVPGISLHSYLARVLKYCPVTNEVFLSLLVYFDRIAKKANNLKQSKKESMEDDTDNQEDSDSEQLFVMDSFNIHRLIISGITVSSKFFSDIFYKNLRYAKVGGLPLEELNYLELQFLLLLDFKLMISVEDLQNYGDLLLRFWKREQMTNELVHGSEDPNEHD